VATYAVEAERLGVDYVWSAEAWGHDAATPIAFVAARTTRVKLGTAIMQAGTRTPALVAMTAMSLDAMSNGRFLLGLGVSGPQVIEGWHGIPFRQPLQRMREIVEIVRRAIRGERVTYKGSVYELPLPGGEGKALRSAAKPRPDIPIYLATLSPRSLEMTGEIADGWLGTSFMPEHARIFLDPIETGAKRAGRALTDLDLQVPAGVVAFGDDVEPSSPRASPGSRSRSARWARAGTTSTTMRTGARAMPTSRPRCSGSGSRTGVRTRRPGCRTSSSSRPISSVPRR
jgi:F420-dependent oxidoreductase-like protein